MKNITLFALCMSISNIALAEGDLYTLTNSNQNTSFLFEKSINENDELQKYELVQVSTPKGIEYQFNIVDESSKPTIGNWSMLRIISKNSEQASQICSLSKLDNAIWRSPSNTEVEGAMDNLDTDFINAMLSTGKDYGINGYTSDGAFYWANTPQSGGVVSGMSGEYETLCIRQ
ncbi:hypothetical protein CGK40_25405 [Vibrio parahaemolyticus]|uniref:hypothetical protein n=1 Tax=Vibrio parahaemolyticus TaxID=670 RepID=UPI0011223941|nr:hypothetical protein [Vibrio parahaemolyticus]TNZ83723.1 hypothetical protein CGK40_25405 [Vibrio parahaemolyticus]